MCVYCMGSRLKHLYLTLLKSSNLCIFWFQELRNTLDEERVLAESKIAELTQMRNDLQKEVADKDEHIERITYV